MKSARAPRQPRAPRGPFFHAFDVRSLKGEPRSLDLAATEEECAAVARSIGLPAIGELRASFRLRPRAGGRVLVHGDVKAVVTQVCVVTLEPFESRLDQPVELVFAPAADPIAVDPRVRGGRGVAELPISVAPPVGGNDDQEDPPDVILDDTIDLGAVAVEFLAIALDPYPRRPGVHFDDMVVGDKDEPAPSAFAALARFKDPS